MVKELNIGAGMNYAVAGVHQNNENWTCKGDSSFRTIKS